MNSHTLALRLSISHTTWTAVITTKKLARPMRVPYSKAREWWR